MKIVTLLTATAVLASTFMSCKKEVTNVQDPVMTEPVTDPVMSYVDPANLIISSNSQLKRLIPVKAYFNSNIGGYLLSKPYNYSKTNKNYPLLITLHGSGLCGNGRSQLYQLTKNSIPRLIQIGKFPKTIKVNGKTFSFIVIAPQFKHSPKPEDINALINHAIKKYRVNPSRVYLTGLSMGGGAVMNFAVAHPNKLAAIVPMAECASPTSYRARTIASGKLPIWAFHNKYDNVVPSHKTITYVKMIQDYTPRVQVKKTIFSTKGHNCWLKATNPDYKQDNKNIYQWMLQFKRN
jgi:predicted peptidase